MEISKWVMNTEKYKGLECTPPCSLYSVLLDRELIKDPFVGLNEYEVRELLRESCEFIAEFEWNEEEKANTVIRFHGLDTLCEIYLNGKKLGKTHDMHRTYDFNVKGILMDGKNELCVKIESPLEFCDKMDRRHHLAENADSYKGLAHIRKASYMFGWDWGPVLPDMGISRKVEILNYDVRLENANILQKHKKGYAELTVEPEIWGEHSDCSCIAVFDGKEYAFDGESVCIKIENPKLWWPRGYGEQNLYKLELKLFKNGVLCDTLRKNIGIRTVEVSRNEDKYGEEFCFCVNSEKIFSMGANYIPQDNILSRITEEKTENLIKQCVAANYNTIRVWGGGYYPEDYFYDLCDRYGLLVWQDFMIACNDVYLRKEFREDLINEAIDNVKRLRHHASLALLCGNNEMEWILGNRLEQDRKNSLGNNAANDLVVADYLETYEHLLPDICEEYAPQVFYWQASPSSGGGFVNPNDPNRGDVHYWEVWHGDKGFEDYRNYRFRFLSEFGFEAFPSVKTIKSFAKDTDMNVLSEVMESHQKCKKGTRQILSHLSANYLYPGKFDDFVYASQLMQAEAIKYGVEHMRKYRGICMGAIYWQVNDCWPVVSWSSIDYFGRWKALHYYAKKFFAPVLLSVHEDGFVTTFSVSNETMSEFLGKVVISARKRDFTELYRNEIDVTVKKLAANDVYCRDFVDIFKGREREYFLLAELFASDGKKIMSRTLCYVKPKCFKYESPEISAKITKKDGKVNIAVQADTFCKGVMIDFRDLDLVLSDNYFDIADKDGVTVSAECDYTEELLRENMIIKSVYNIR